LNEAELIWKQKLEKLEKKLERSERANSKLASKYEKLENVKNDLTNALALNSAQLIRIRRLEAKEELLNSNLDNFRSSVTVLVDMLQNLKDYHLDMESKLKHSYNKRVDIIKDLNAVNLDSFKLQFNTFVGELLNIDSIQDFSKKGSKLKNDVIFDDLAKKILPSKGGRKSTRGGKKKRKVANHVERENKKLKERLVYVAADNYVQKNEINNLKLDFWKQ
jgi:hypothetical protein